MPTAPTILVLPLLSFQEPTAPSTGPAERSATGAGTGAGTAVPTTPGGPQGPGPNAPTLPCDTTSMGMMGLFIALMWFMVLRPESKRRKETAAMLAALKQGDHVVTIGGMHGVVDSIQEKTAVLRIGDQRLTFDRSAIARVLRDEPLAGTKKS